MEGYAPQGGEANSHQSTMSVNTSRVQLRQLSPLYSDLQGALSVGTGAWRTEVTLLIVLAVVGMLGNLATLLVILTRPRLRRASNAFLCHQCVLDFLKAAYCLPFAQSLVVEQSATWCGILGGSYIVFVTGSSFNLLAIVMNEAYHFADLTMNIKDSRNYCCVIFGVFTIWFGSVIMNLGVAFIPGNLSFNREQGRCVFIHGVTQNFVLQMLWVVLITLSVCLTVVYLHKLHVDVRRVGYYRLSTLVRTTFHISPTDSSGPGHQEEARDRLHIRRLQSVTRKKLCLMSLHLALFIAFWYPLFTLAACDPRSRVSASVYTALTLLAWSNAALTPATLLIFLRADVCCADNTPVHTAACVEEGPTSPETQHACPTSTSTTNNGRHAERGSLQTAHTESPTNWVFN